MQKRVLSSEKQLAEIIKSRRKELQVTQKELAAFCNLSHNGISQIELGEKEIKLSTLLKMSKMLGLSVVIEIEE